MAFLDSADDNQRKTKMNFFQTIHGKKYKRIYITLFHSQFDEVQQHWKAFPVSNYMLKVNKRNARTRCEICSKLTIKTPDRRQWRRSGVFIFKFEHILNLVLVFLLLTLST